jgi:hypothetical protein
VDLWFPYVKASWTSFNLSLSSSFSSVIVKPVVSILSTLGHRGWLPKIGSNNSIGRNSDPGRSGVLRAASLVMMLWRS